MKPMEARRAELLSHVAAVAAAEACTLGLDEAQAAQIGAAVADTLAEDFGGQVLSFPKDAAYKLSAREREILDAHRHGATYLELMARYRMTERGLRKLIKRAEARDRDLRQQSLFEV